MNIEFVLYLWYYDACEFWHRSSWLDLIAYVAIVYFIIRLFDFTSRLRITYEKNQS